MCPYDSCFILLINFIDYGRLYTMAFYSTLPLDPLIQETLSLEEKQPVFKRVFRYASTQCTAAFRVAISDLRSIRRARAGLWTLFGAWALGVVGIFVYLLAIGIPSDTWDERTACSPDNFFNVNASAYNVWSGSGFFEINLGSGSLTFTQAKLIDISWDIVRSTRNPLWKFMRLIYPLFPRSSAVEGKRFWHSCLGAYSPIM